MQLYEISSFNVNDKVIIYNKVVYKEKCTFWAAQGNPTCFGG